MVSFANLCVDLPERLCPAMGLATLPLRAFP